MLNHDYLEEMKERTQHEMKAHGKSAEQLYTALISAITVLQKTIYPVQGVMIIPDLEDLPESGRSQEKQRQPSGAIGPQDTVQRRPN